MTAPPESIRVEGRQVPVPGRRVGYRRPEPLPPAFFESQRARAAMGARDVHEVFAVLAGMGVSQRRIAALTGQSQSEISEIRAGRMVRSVDVIERIADGLGTPRGWWGLAHTDDAIAPQGTVPDADAPTPDVTPLDSLAPVARAQMRPAPAPGPMVAPSPTVEIAVARHLIGLIGALRVSLAPRPVAIRSAQHGLGPRRTRRLKQARRR
jgi:transcriptional regulator with XRE-family HTH domain